MRSMRCAVIRGPGDVRVVEAPAPTPGDGESLVRITSVGLCGSDLHWWVDGGIGDAILDEPLVLGHEMAGIVESGPLVGRTVAIDPAVPCGDCRECASGLDHMCEHMRFAGHGRTGGGLAELIAWPDAHLHVLPDGFDGAVGALLEPLGVAVHAVDLGHLRPGSTVAVVGCGPIGLMIVQLALGAGCEVVAVDPLPHRRDAARRAGARSVLGPDDDGLVNECDVAFEVSGADLGLDHAARLVRPGARIVIVGIPDGDRTSFAAALMRRKGLTLALSRRMTVDAYRRAIALGTDGHLDLGWLVSHRFRIDEAPAAFEFAHGRSGLKVIIDVADS